MPKALSEWTKHDLDEFFERHKLTPQQIVPVLGSGALTMAQMSSLHGESEMGTFYKQISAELIAYVIEDLGHKA
jgi:hypothetical protein